MNITIAEVPKDAEKQCVACFRKATWTIDIVNVFLSLCDDCCDKLSKVSGDVGVSRDNIVDITQLSPRDAKILMTMIDADVEPNEVLQRAFEHYKRMVE